MMTQWHTYIQTARHIWGKIAHGLTTSLKMQRMQQILCRLNKRIRKVGSWGSVTDMKVQITEIILRIKLDSMFAVQNWYYVNLQSKQQRSWEFDLQKVNQKWLFSFLLGWCRVARMLPPAHKTRKRFTRAPWEWNMYVLRVWNAISAWHFLNQPPPPSGRAEERCLWPKQQRESRYDSALFPSEASVNLWVGGSVNQDCYNSHTLSLEMCLLDYKGVWQSCLELWGRVYLKCFWCVNTNTFPKAKFLLINTQVIGTVEKNMF